MSGYVKIYGSILGSSVWAEAPATRIVWITMLALADQNGKVDASISGLARFANVTIPECRKALDALAEPDIESKSPEWGGRRVDKVEGGWLILNYLKYREMRSPKQVADAERQAEKRKRDGRDGSQQSHKDGDSSPPSPKSQRVATAVDVAVDVAVTGTEDRSKAASTTAREKLLAMVPDREMWEAELKVALDGMHGPALSEDQVEQACRDYLGNGASKNPNLGFFRVYLKTAAKGGKPPNGQPNRGGSRNDAAIDARLNETERGNYNGE